jgi:SAM-dependent methyltransferase
MDAMSAQERVKYERMWAFTEYRDDHVTAHAETALAAFRPGPGDSIIDFGAGAGYACAAFLSAGLQVLAVDIAVNAMAPDLTPHVPRLLGSLWDIPVSLVADWGFCCDVMEHIPPTRVEEVLRTIRRSTRRATYFCISLRPDGCGELIGERLHLTVRSLAWWLDQIRCHWPTVRVLSHAPGEHAVFIGDDAADAAAPDRRSQAAAATRASIYVARMTALARRMSTAGIAECLVFGSAEAGQTLAAVAPGHGLIVRGFVRSSAVRAGETAAGLPVLSLEDAVNGTCHAYAIGSFGSAPAMLAALEAGYAKRAHRYSVSVPDGPAPV